MPPRAALWFACGVALTALHTLPLGAVSEAALLLLTTGATGAIVVGIRRNRPQPSWPWWFLVATAVLFTAAGVLRSAADATGDLTSGRSLWPDAFALPGYVLFMFALLGLTRFRGGHRTHAEDNLDAVILALGCLLLVWVGLLGPVLRDVDGALRAEIAVGVYPPIAAFVAAIAARLAFTPGRRSAAYFLLLIGLVGNMIGEVIYFLVETAVLTPPPSLVDLPYAISYTLIATAALHPSVRQVTVPPPRTGLVAMSRARVALIGGVILVPAALLPLWRPADRSGALLTGGLALALAGVAVVRLTRAVREQALLAAELTYRATHDVLTGLPNRLVVIEHLEALLVNARATRSPVCVMFVDLDQFKLVNDSLGHAAGDRVLLQTGERLVSVLRSEDFVGRLAGDEFVVLLPGIDATRGAEVAHRIRQAFGRPLDLGIDAFVSVSIGMTVSYGHDDAADLLRDADTAMYRAKAQGRDSAVVFDASMRTELDRRVSLEADLRAALAAGELEVHYQPVVMLHDGRVEGFEALCRWRRGDEWVPPIELIAVAEESGLIVQLGEFVLNEALREVARWRAQFGALSVAVNVSAGELHATDLVASVARALDAVGIPGEAVWLEITESVMMHDTADTFRVLDGLHGLGVGICVDDFGTGFSSLSYLQRFPVDRFKIDRSFVTELASPKTEALVRSMLAIGRELRLDIIAEGIEAREEAESLARLGCSLGQGYYFARPMPPSEVAGWLTSRAFASAPVAGA